jgi:DNA invertase Pin-like site-specific DNA recombinase
LCVIGHILYVRRHTHASGGETMNATIYLRVSTGEQADSGAGLNAQADACQAFAQAQGMIVGGTYSDAGVSGAAGLDKRPGLLEALAELGRGGVLIVAKRDRLGRDAIVLAMIEAAVSRKGARVVSAAGEGTESDEPTAILMRRMIDAFSEFERHVIKARTKAALQAKRRRGERVGELPYGFTLEADGRTLTPDAAEQAVIGKIHELRGEGHTLRSIAAELTRQGILTTKGNATWTHQAVASILKRSA